MSNRVQIIFEALNRTKGATKEIEGELKGLEAAAASTRVAMLAVSAAAGVALVGLAREVFSVATEFQGLEASLITVTGSQSAANDEFERLQRFASETPYQLDEVVKAFIKLRALGLDPSSEALRSYGNTASAMNKSLDQMIEAVADAATGEFERLKEFGIKASSEGEKVTFTFRGVKTTVRKEAGEIEAYLRKLGEVEFAGGMQRQMDTIGGATSNLKDEWTLLVNTIGDGGLADAMEMAVRAATSTLRTLREYFGEFNDELKATSEWAAAFSLGQIGFWEWALTGADQAAVRLREIKQEMGSLTEPEARKRLEDLVEQIARLNQAIAFPLNSDTRTAELKAELEERQRQYRDLLRQFAQPVGKPSPDPSPKGGETEEQRKAREKLESEWRKTQAALTLDVEKLGLNQYEQKLADITARAEELRAKFGDRPGIAAWEDAQKAAANLRREIDELQAANGELEQATAGALEAFQGFAAGLETTGGPMAQITEGLRLYEDGAAGAAAATENLGERAGLTFDEMEAAVEGWASGFSGQLNDIFWDADATFEAILESFGRMLSQMVIQKQIVEPLLGAGMDFLRGLGNTPAPSSGGFTPTMDTGGFNLGTPTIKHEGGPIVPRFHFGGLLPDEVPAVLQTGERVLSREQNRTFDKLAALLAGGGSSDGSGGTTVQVINASGQPARTEQGRGTDGRQLVKIIIGEVAKDIRQGGETAAALTGTFGLQRQGVPR